MKIKTIKINNNRLDPIFSLTPDYIENTFNSFKNILIQPLIQQIISDDPDISGLMQKRLSIPYFLIPSVIPASNSKNDLYIADLTYDIISNLIDNNILTQILEANFFRFSIHQINWKIKNGLYIPNSLELLPRSAFEFKNNKLYSYDANSDKFYDIPNFAALISISRFHKNNIPISLIRIIRKYFVIKLFSILDWSAFNELFGIPLRLGKYSDDSSKQDIDYLYQAVLNIGSDAAAIISNNDQIEFISPKNDNPKTFESIYNICKNAQATAILGNSNIAGINKNGSYAALKILSQISEDIILSDIIMINDTINKQLIKYFISLNFNSKNYPKIQFKLPKQYNDMLNIDQNLAKLGVKFNKNYFIRKYDLNQNDFDISYNIKNNDFNKKKTLNSLTPDPFI